MTLLEKQPGDLFGLFSEAWRIGKIRESCRFEGVMFPMVELDMQPDIRWIHGMENGSWSIEQALQQTRFRMNEKGAKVESAAAMRSICEDASAKPTPVLIDGPFLLWIERKGLDVPLFCAVLCEDAWKEPKEL